MAKLSPEAKEAPRGRQSLRFSIPEAFEDGGGLIIECRAFEMGSRGGCGEEVKLSREYWQGLLPKLAAKV